MTYTGSEEKTREYPAHILHCRSVTLSFAIHPFSISIHIVSKQIKSLEPILFEGDVPSGHWLTNFPKAHYQVK
ncbi:MAG: hypothetical protein NPIRA03_15910 [Nitrospirales bacterium]|nr:MAG: hypothetical protein NPIRA03_15910 [Nitrospirales bacterium]